MKRSNASPPPLDLELAWFVASLCFFLLAEVFAHGLRMRADLEGTV